MRIYIAGKITGDENYQEKFKKAEAAIAAIGHEPINPACLRLPASCSWKNYMALTLSMLDLADAVCLLPDWKESPGACVEIGYAAAKDKTIITADAILPSETQQESKPVALEDPIPQSEKDTGENEMAESKAKPKSIRVCPVCGKSFDASGRKIYCSVNCRNLNMNMAKKENLKSGPRQKKNKPPEVGDPVNDCPNDCRFLGRVGSLKTCDYMLLTGDPRESDMRPGGCDRYEVKWP